MYKMKGDTVGMMELHSCTEVGVKHNRLEPMMQIMSILPQRTWATSCQEPGMIWKIIRNTFLSMVL